METDAKVVAEQFIERLHRLEGGGEGELGALAELFSEDAVLVNPALEHRGTEGRGREGVVQFWKNYRSAFGVIRSEFSHITTSEGAAGLFWRSEGTNNSDGHPISYAGATLLEIDGGGKIRRFRGFFEQRDLHQVARNN